MRKTIFTLFFVVLSVGRLCAQTFLPGNLVQNPGFESGFSGWNGTYGILTPPPGVALEGVNVGVIDTLQSSSTHEALQQAIPTVAGDQYEIQFSLLSGYGLVGEYPDQGNALINVLWGGASLGQVTNPSTTSWDTFDFFTTASSSSTTLEFLDPADEHLQLIDAVSVSQVPEPQTSLLFVGGLALFYIRCLTRRIRRQT